MTSGNGQTAHSALNLAMVGGGEGAFIGAVHRKAAALDDQFRLVAGCFSSDATRSRAFGPSVGVDASRSYGHWREMFAGEKGRIDAVSIVTPNHSHFEIAAEALRAGFDVILDKPMVTTAAQARELAAIVRESGRILAVTYNYTGYPMVKHAAALVRAGALGTIRKVFVEYHQGWLATDLESTGMKQAAWRTDPARAGLGGAIGDIGSHAENLLTTITGLRIEALRAELRSFVAGRKLDDDATVLLRLAGPGTQAHGVLTASQVCIGEKNNLSIRVYGSAGALTWRQEDPDTLHVAQLDGTARTLSRGSAELDESARRATRLPPGHPEGFLEAFANIYRGVAQAIHARRRGAAPEGLGAEFPTVDHGARGVAFIEAVVQSSRDGGVWVTPAIA